MKGLSTILMASLLGSLMDQRKPKKSNKESYLSAVKVSAEENQAFLISLFDKIMGEAGDEPFTALQFVDAMLVYQETGSDYIQAGSTPEEMVEHKVPLLEEITRILDYWTDEKAFIGSSDEVTVHYSLTEYGRGLIAGYKIGTNARGETKFTVIKKLTDDELAAMDMAEQKPKEAKELCDCGNPDCPANELAAAIAQMRTPRGARRRPTRGDDAISRLMDIIGGR